MKAVAVVARFPNDDPEDSDCYREGKGVDLLPAVEVIISPPIVKKFKIPANSRLPTLLQCYTLRYEKRQIQQVDGKRRSREIIVMPEYCVTGGTGFIAAHLIRALLAAGHTVRATVRDPEDEGKVGFLWDLDGANERLQLVRADLMVEGSFDEAVNGVDGVFHTASPVVVSYDDRKVRENLIDPIVKGAANVLRSCARAAAPRRVVFTSSCSCVRYCHGASSLNESHWSDADYCKAHGLWYAYAKTLAEKEAWRLAKEHGLDLVVVNPSFVIGPVLGPRPTSTVLVVLAMLRGELARYPNTTIGFVHVDDVVLSHVLAMEDARASGRLICSCRVAHWSEILPSLRERYPRYPIPTECSSQKGDDRPHRMDTSKIKALGVPPFLSVQQMFDDCIKSFQEKGLLP